MDMKTVNYIGLRETIAIVYMGIAPTPHDDFEYITEAIERVLNEESFWTFHYVNVRYKLWR